MFDLSALNTTGMVITFVKKNGEERVMKCTKNLSMIPSENHPKGTGSAYTSKQIRVYDLEKNGWRSFLIDSVIKAESL